MHLDGSLALAGALVGLAVGLTGMGGGALLTPILVLVLGVSPGVAVSSDLVASFFMRPVGAVVHLRRRTVDFGVVGWLTVGSVPAAVAGAWALHVVTRHGLAQTTIRLAVGAALLAAVAGITLKTALGPATGTGKAGAARQRRAALVAVGVAGGFIVGMTSVGAGSLMMVALMYLYPAMPARRLVGTDTVQALPLVGAAALGQAAFGHVSLDVSTSLIIGAVPGVWVGARLSSVAQGELLRPVLAAVLLASALRLLGVGTWLTVGISLAGGAGLGWLFIRSWRTAGDRSGRVAGRAAAGSG